MAASKPTTPLDPHAPDDPVASQTFYVFIIGAILFLVLVVFAIALFQNRQIIEDQNKLYTIPAPRELAELQAGQLAHLSEPRWVDPNAGLVAVPIDDAIPLFVDHYKAAAATRPATIPLQAAPATRPSTPATAPAKP